jgi:uncharacterized membrane protein
VSRPSASDRIDTWLSWLLRGGTWLALALIAIGFALNLVSGQSWLSPTDLTQLLSGGGSLRADPPANLAELAFGFGSLESLRFIQAAILILILLPALRVAFLLGNFAKRRDWIFVAFSTIVLAALLAGFVFRLEL